MEARRTKVPAAVRNALIAEAGGKCANPGCPYRRTEYHHINEWAVYATHDKQHMIAICPSCHDAAHHGALRITANTLYRWKGIERGKPRTDVLFVESGTSPKLLLGGSTYTTDNESLIFEFDKGRGLTFRIEDDALILVTLRLTDRASRELITIKDNRVGYNHGKVEYQRTNGRINVSVPLSSEFYPQGVLNYICVEEPDLVKDDRLTILDAEIVEPGVIKLKGVWIKDEIMLGDGATIISDSRIHWMMPLGFCTVMDSEYLATLKPSEPGDRVSLGNISFDFGSIVKPPPATERLYNEAVDIEESDIDKAIFQHQAVLATLDHSIDSAIVDASHRLSALHKIKGDLNSALTYAHHHLWMTAAKHIAHSNVATILYDQNKIETARIHKYASINCDPEVTGAFLKMKRVLKNDRNPEESTEELTTSCDSKGTWEMLAAHLSPEHRAVLDANIDLWAKSEGHSVQAEQSGLLGALHTPILFRFVDYEPHIQRWPSKPQVNKFFGFVVRGGSMLPLPGRT